MDPRVYPKGHVKPENLEKVLVPFGYDERVKSEYDGLQDRWGLKNY